MTRFVLATLAIASVCYAMPTSAEEVGVGVGPVGVEVHGVATGIASARKP
jgi:hypothetical protein